MHRRLTGLVLAALTIVMVPLTASPASAETTDWAGVGGPIPDNDPAGREVSFNVSGLSGSPTSVSVTFDFSTQHTHVGDLTATLVAPNGTAHPLWTAELPSGTNLIGPYTFTDAAAVSPTWWSAAAAGTTNDAIPSGSYRTSSTTGANTAMNPAFASAPATGTWKLRIVDQAAADTGTIGEAHLTLTSPDSVSDSSDQQQSTVTVAANAGGGYLAVDISRPSVNFGQVLPGQAKAADAGYLTAHNSLGTGANWSTTVAATSLTTGSTSIPFTALAMDPAETVTQYVEGFGCNVMGSGVSPGLAGSFSGADTVPGTTLSAPRTMLSASGTVQGTIYQYGMFGPAVGCGNFWMGDASAWNKLTLSVPMGHVGGVYYGTIQYSILG